jgi:hypothetical protein
VDLARQVLEKALQLLAVAVGGGEKLLGVGLLRLEPPHVVELQSQLAPKALGAAPNLDWIAALESRADSVGLAEHPRPDRAAAIAQLQRQVGGAVAGHLAVLANAGVATRERHPRGQFSDLRSVVIARGGLGLCCCLHRHR